MHIIIPARYSSTRLPGKPLLDIAGQPMIARVVGCARASGAQHVVVATDDERIRDAVMAIGAQVVMTRADHLSGTDRLAEAITLLDLDDDEIVINLQGDEPLMPPTLIRQVAALLAARPAAVMATACHAIGRREDFLNPNAVKVVTDREGHALYFSRAPIPWARDAFAATPENFPAGLPAYRHIGIYAYRTSFLKIYKQLQPAAIEQFEALEQLRALWHGYRIGVAVVEQAPVAGVDTEEDLQRVRRLLN